MDGALLQAFLFLLAAVVAVPLAQRFGLGSVLGYLIAGIAIEPALARLGAKTEDLQHFGEFGVVMMLFLIGLELEPRQLWAMRTRLVGLGGLQLGLTTGGILCAALLLDTPWTMGLAVGLILALSSTAIVLQSLDERGLTRSDGGRAAFSVLLSQDIAVIPMLVLLPLLALPELKAIVGAEGWREAGSEAEHSASLLQLLPAWAVPFAVLGAIGIVIGAGHFLTRPMFRFLSLARLPEIFTAAALLLVIGIALLMSAVGLSPALGTFLAGVVLADSEYRHELEADIAPFKGLLLGLFFITVGAGIDFSLLWENLGPVIGITLGLMSLKVAVLAGLALAFRIRGREAWLFALSLAQAGEFGFVLTNYTVQNAVIPKGYGDVLSLVIALSMLLTPLLFIFHDRLIAPLRGGEAPPDDEITEPGTVIIAGLGRFGQIVNRLLLANGHKTVVLDSHNELIAGLRKFGVESYFGDPSRPEMLLAAGIRDAKALIVALDDRQRALKIVQYVTREHPHVRVVARAYDRVHTFQLYSAGARDIVRETFDSAVRAGRYALEALGHHPYEVEKAIRVYVREDRHHLVELARLWDPELNSLENEAYLSKAREINAQLDEAMRGTRTQYHEQTDRAWTPPPKGGHPKDESAA